MPSTVPHLSFMMLTMVILLHPTPIRSCIPTSTSSPPADHKRKCCGPLIRHHGDHSDHHHRHHDHDHDHHVHGGHLLLEYSKGKCPQRMVAICTADQSDHGSAEVALIANGDYFLAVHNDKVSSEAKCGHGGRWVFRDRKEGKSLELHRLQCVVAGGKRHKCHDACAETLSASSKKRCKRCVEESGGTSAETDADVVFYATDPVDADQAHGNDQHGTDF